MMRSNIQLLRPVGSRMPCDNDDDDDPIEKPVVSADLGHLFTLGGSDDLDYGFDAEVFIQTRTCVYLLTNCIYILRKGIDRLS